jgi:hypothetical protein
MSVVSRWLQQTTPMLFDNIILVLILRVATGSLFLSIIVMVVIKISREVMVSSMQNYRTK